MKSFMCLVAVMFTVASATADEEFYERKETVRSHRITQPETVVVERRPVYRLVPVYDIEVPVLRSIRSFSAKETVVVPARTSRFKYTEIRRGLFGRPKSILEVEGD